MATRPIDPHRVVLGIKGKIRFQRENDAAIRTWVYQRTVNLRANIRKGTRLGLQLRRRVFPFDPRAPKTLARRAWFRAGMAEFKSLTPTELVEWETLAHKRRTLARCAFMREWLRAFPTIRATRADPPNQLANLLAGAIVQAPGGILQMPNQLKNRLSGYANYGGIAELRAPNQLLQTLAGLIEVRTNALLRSPNQLKNLISARAMTPVFGTEFHARAPGDGDAALPWGTNVRKMAATVGTTVNGSTKTSHPLPNIQSIREVRPFETSTATPGSSNYGWGLHPDDVQSTALHLASIAAANWTFTFSRNRVNASIIGQDDFSVTIYKVGPSPSYTRALIATGTAVVARTPADLVVVITLNPGAISLAAGESLMFNYHSSAASNPASNATITYQVGHWLGAAAADFKITFPGFTYT